MPVVLKVFAKAPVIGQVKTRLAVDVGTSVALQAHIELVERTLRRARAFCCDRELWISETHPVLPNWQNLLQAPGFVQSGAELGARMYHAMGRSSPDDVCILIGTDCPAIDEHYLQAAADALQQVPVVLGPAEDGGYGLIGIRNTAIHSVRGIFEGMAWGQSDVCSVTCHRLDALNVTYECLDTIWDVDRLADWQRYQAFKKKS